MSKSVSCPEMLFGILGFGGLPNCDGGCLFSFVIAAREAAICSSPFVCSTLVERNSLICVLRCSLNVAVLKKKKKVFLKEK